MGFSWRQYNGRVFTFKGANLVVNNCEWREQVGITRVYQKIGITDSLVGANKKRFISLLYNREGGAGNCHVYGLMVAILHHHIPRRGRSIYSSHIDEHARAQILLGNHTLRRE